MIEAVDAAVILAVVLVLHGPAVKEQIRTRIRWRRIFEYL